MLNREISNSDDIIDSREVIERIETLASEAEDLFRESVEDDDAETPPGFDPTHWLESWDAEEYRALVALAEAGEGTADWTHGATLIRESYFEDYAREFAQDVYGYSEDSSWPLRHIDWEAAADELKIDYSEIDFDGVAYFVRD
jgi:hypothetical protein